MKSMEELRDETIKRLEYGYSHGEISLDELEKRIEIAVNTSIEEDLKPLVLDLKSEPEVKPTFQEKPEETIMSVLSSVQRKGRWTPARANKIFVFMGSVELDFSEAELNPGVTDFEFFTVMGGIEVRVPEGINVELSGLPLLAGIENKLSHSQYPGNPTIKLHGTAFMSGVEIKPPKKKKRKKA